MMTVFDIFQIKGRGAVLCVKLDGPAPELGARLKRKSDGAEWVIRGVERGVRLPRAGENAALLIGDGPPPTIGDEVERMTDA